ncbi:MAG: hypothetical protein ACYC8T_33805 [Myxococcaceae bacterium]
MAWLDRTPLRWLIRAVIGTVALLVLRLIAGAILKAAGVNTVRLFQDYGLGEGFGLRAAVFLLAFPLGAEVLGVGGTAKALSKLLVLAAAVAFVCAPFSPRPAFLEPLVLLLGAATAMAAAIDGKVRYLYALGLGLLAVLAQTGKGLGEDFSGKSLLSWLLLALLVHGPAVVIATFLATGEKLSIRIGQLSR